MDIELSRIVSHIQPFNYLQPYITITLLYAYYTVSGNLSATG